MIFGMRNWIRAFGVLLLTCGFTCIPIGAGAHPYYFTLTFSYLAESGALFRTGLILVALGVLLIIGSLFRTSDRTGSRNYYYW